MEEIRDYAEQILFGRTLQEKIASPKTLHDTRPGLPIVVPDAPKRPPELAFERAHRRVPFPKPNQLNDEKKRAIVLHHFANHEMLALELMALMLLRFPHAPSRFRRTLVHTMRDEQKHLLLYQERMTELGLAMGDVPVNRFFWDVLSETESPMSFICGMSLTFEQANLDFSLYWKNAFEQAGDIKTASVLHDVLEDEIRHVRMGHHWFQSFKPAECDDWEAYTNGLTFPLTPSRAKGTLFSIDARRAAGLSEAFIQNLSVFRHSKGRSPDLLWLNLRCEDELGFPSRTPKKNMLALEQALSHLAMFWAKSDDIVLVHERPEPSWLQQVQALGMPLPEFLVWDGKKVPHLQHPRLSGVKPWGWTPNANQLAKSVANRLSGAQSVPPWDSKWRQWYSKCFANEQLVQWLDQSGTDLGLSHAMAGATLQDATSLPPATPTHPLLIKAPFSTSGRHRIRLEGPPSPSSRDWVQRHLSEQGALLAEPFLDKLADFSVHFERTEIGLARPEITRFFTDDNGKYRGTLVTRWDEGLPSAWMQALQQFDGKPHWIRRVIESISDFLSPKLEDFPGTISIDMMLYAQADQSVGFKPIVEINPRITMSRLARNCRRMIAPKKTSVWLMGHARDAQLAGFEDLSAFREYADRVHPLQTIKGRISRGVFWLTPRQCPIWVCLWTADSLAEAANLWCDLVQTHQSCALLTQWCEQR